MMVWVEVGASVVKAVGTLKKAFRKVAPTALLISQVCPPPIPINVSGIWGSVRQKAISRSSASSEEAPENSTVQAVIPAAWNSSGIFTLYSG